MTKKFIKKIEDFICERCGFFVKGTGYTNHCPKCLWCKHVDVNPGDRLSDCGGMMAPISVEKKGKEYFINYKCQKCGFERANGMQKEDNFEEIIRISSSRAII